MNKQKLQIDQLEAKIKAFTLLRSSSLPNGWIRAVRLALGMSLQQLATRLSITKQSAQQMEQREKNGSISIKSLRETARVLDMKLVYGFVPNDGSLDALIERKAFELATKIVSRTSTTMSLENQGNSKERIKKAISERAGLLKHEMPKILWD